jgi:hypothetical protein
MASNPSAAERVGCAPQAALLGVALLVGPWAIIIVSVAAWDFDYIVRTARSLQLALVIGAFAVVALLIGAGTVGVIGAYTRWASPKARKASTKIAIARAVHPELPEGLHSFTMPPASRAEPARLIEPPPQIIEAEPPALALPAPAAPSDAFVYGRSRLQQLVERGHVARSGDSLLVGYDAQLRPRYVEAPQWGLMVIGGQTQKGKSSAAALVIAQAALLGWDVFLCDPVRFRPKSLAGEYLASVTGAIYRQAVRPAEIAHTIRLVAKIAQRRIGGERWDRRVLLAIDEFSVLVGNRQLPDDVLDTLALMVLQAAAVGVHVLIAGHDFNARLFGARFARPFRGASTHRLIFNMDTSAAELVLPSGEAARQVGILPPGQALYFDGAETPTLLSVPWLMSEDLAYAAQGRPPRAYVKWDPPQPAALIDAPAPQPAALIDAPAPRATPPTERLDPTLDDRIVDLLSASGELDAEQIAARLGANLGTTKNRLGALRGLGMLNHRRQDRRYVYSVPRRAQAA